MSKSGVRYIPRKHEIVSCLICKMKFTQRVPNQKACNEKCIVIKDRFYKYKHEATRRGLSFNLEVDDFLTLIGGKCNYCGASEKIGIDRRTNNEGYMKSNLVSCCKTCNRLKNVLSAKAYFNICKMVAEHSSRAL